MMGSYTDGNGDKRWVPAPSNYNATVTSGDVLGVYLASDEEVEWFKEYRETGEGRVVGYKIKKKL